MASTNTQVSTHGSGRAGSSSNIDSEPSVIHSDSQESTQSALRERILYLEQNVVRNNRQHPLSRDREQCKTQEGELLGKRKAIDHELEPVQKRLKEVSARFDELNEEQIRAERKALGISEELWRHFQVFCESLQPKKSVARELLPLNGTQDASYQSYDPDFSIFKKSVGDEEWLSDVNWRCNRVPVYSICGTAIGYSVEYQVLRKDHSGLEWGSSFVSDFGNSC
ncbi:hypothetical protein F5Y17DRAFT_28830 [Xylariaceae sp. FL0594]|nr:hypothetical protein F5Y17DRAFT_28830 [Xylariaceae sp. FL0594]